MPLRNHIFDLMGLNYLEKQLDQINSKLDRLLVGQTHGKAMIMSEQEEIQNLIQQVAANRDAGQAAAQAMSGMLQRISDQGKELQEAIANGGTDVSADIKAAADDLQASTAALQDAVPHIATAIMQGTKAAQ